jgi:1-acyl-sn-glycerol-3-phosphate acyltransferase
MPASYSVSAYAVYKTLAISIPTVIEAMLGRVTVERSDRRLRAWAHSIVDRAEVDVTIDGLEHLPREACVLMSNHQSHFDIPICYVAFPRTLRMVAKAELFKVPIWGRAMREAGFVAVDRSGNREQAMAAMRQAAQAIRGGVNVWIAPEGTRSPDGKLGKLKKGGFLLAKETKTPILPLCIDGTRHIIPKDSRLVRPHARVKVTFGAPIATDGRDVASLMAEVRRFLELQLSGDDLKASAISDMS